MLKDQLQTLAKYLENKLYYLIFKAINILKTILTAYLRASKSYQGQLQIWTEHSHTDL